MRQRAIDGGPNHWYNHEGYILCPARGCIKVFDSTSIRRRGHHWYDDDPVSPSYNDHGILLAIDRQIDCVYCTYRNDRSLRDLVAHEQNQHGSSDMSTMEGYLRLVRQGLDTDEARLCRDQAHLRLMYNIWNSPYRNRLLYHMCPQIPPHETHLWKHLDPILSYQNRLAGRPHAVVILAQDFLTHLRPTADDQSTWPETYHHLRALYAEGRI